MRRGQPRSTRTDTLCPYTPLFRCLRHRVELDRALLGPLGLEDRGRVPAVEAELGVGVVVDDDDLVLASEVDELLEEVEVDAGGGGVVGERDRKSTRLNSSH